MSSTQIWGNTSFVRSNSQRFFMLMGVVAIEAIAMYIAIAGYFPSTADHKTGGAYWGPMAAAIALAVLTILAVHLVVFAFLAPLVSYRWFDTFFLVVPVVSTIFWFRVVWRVTALPHRYWPAREEELPAHPRPVHDDLPAEDDLRAWHY